MTLKQQIKLDAVRTFLNTNEFAEWIKYTPYGGSVKSIKAIVNRKQLDASGEDTGRMLGNMLEIMIANDPTHGVMSIKKGFDKAKVPEFSGGGVYEYLVADILGNDDGMWHLLLQR